MQRVLRAAFVGALAVSLAGCTAPAVDQDAAQDWLRGVQSENASSVDLFGSTGGLTSTPESAAGDDAGGITLTPGEPGTVTAVSARCFGGVTALIRVEVNAQALARAVESDIPCDEEVHLVALGEIGELTGVTAVTIDVSSNSQTTYYADVLS